MRICLFYWLVEPIRDRFWDSSESAPAFEVPIVLDNKVYTLALFTDTNGAPEYARLMISNLHSDALHKDALPLIQTVKEHFLSVLRVTYDPEVRLFPRPIWTFIDENTPYTIGLETSQQIRDTPFDPDKTRRLFMLSFPHREELRLWIDGQDWHIPLQYRYLSLYKILELHFKNEENWRENELEVILEKYGDRFVHASVRRKPLTYIHQLRDKCAHIRMKGKKETIGVTHLRQKEAAAVEQMLPILTDICAEVINTHAKGSFEIQRLGNDGSQIALE